MNAVTFSRVLMAAIGLLAAGALVCFYLLSVTLSRTVSDTDHAMIDAGLSRSDIDRLKRLEIELKNNQDVALRAQNIVAQSSAYQYQDQIINDVNTYAAKAGVSIGGYDFKPTGTQQSKSPVPADGVKTISATVNLNGPMEFEKFLKFLKAIEQNLTKMQVTSIGISKDDKTPSLVNNPNVGLEIYVK